MGEVFVVGVSSAGCGAGAGTARLAHDAARSALADADVSGTAISAVFVSSGSNAPVPSADAVAVRLGLRRLGLRSSGRGAPEPDGAGRIECVSTSGVEALHRAVRAVELGIDDLVLCVGSEPDAAAPLPWQSWPPRSVLRARACAARRYLAASGATAAQLARVVTKNRVHGAARGVACELALADVVNAEVAEWPLTRPMVACCGRGVAAVVLASERAARGLGRTDARVSASVLVAGTDDDPEATGRAGRLAYGDAGLGPEDLDCAELHDATAAHELVAYEQLGIAPEGHAGELLDSGFTEARGVLPVNLTGGLLSLGERPGAAAVAQVAELTRQLRGDASALQVDGARAVLAHCAGRPGGDGSGVVGVTVLTL